MKAQKRGSFTLMATGEMHYLQNAVKWRRNSEKFVSVQMNY